MTQIPKKIFSVFDWSALSKDEQEILKRGIEKHRSVLKSLFIFAIPQLFITLITPEIMVLLTAVSFISLLLGSAWYSISFQNVSADQLDAGVADYITKCMFRAFMLSLNALLIGVIVFIIKLLLPEILLVIPSVDGIPLWIRGIIALSNLMWVALVWMDIYRASVTYDAADSLLGDGFPTLMRGAKANTNNLPSLDLLKEIRDLLKGSLKK